MEPQPKTLPPHSLALILSGLANFLLGASTLYWRELNEVSPIALVAYRITLSTATLTIFILIFRRSNQIKNFTLKLIRLHCIASFLIAINWETFIWSSINGYVLESGLGYLLAPFISIVLGELLYHDPISTRKTISILTALSSVVLLILFTDNLNHWTYLLIATTWGTYTYIKKHTSLDAVNGLFVETLFLTTCLALAILLFNFRIAWPNELSTRSNQLIWLAGGVSTIPLLMFSYATGKIPLSLTGLLQFILPLTLLSISLFFYKQKTPNTSLALTIVIICILITIIAYDTMTSQPSQKEANK